MSGFAEAERNTRKTRRSVSLEINGTGKCESDTGYTFLVHMLPPFCSSRPFGSEIHVRGGIDVGYHHTVEDSGLIIGELIKKALERKKDSTPKAPGSPHGCCNRGSGRAPSARAKPCWRDRISRVEYEFAQ
ncbi:MAG: hypothetical protein KGY56_13320 [Desulfobacterales bacterium]|nr:hypothetical protein [Desulfobacterales bacterium]